MHRRRDVGLARPQAHGARRNLLCRVPSPTASLHCGSDLRGLDALASLDGPARHPLPRPDRSGTPVAIRVLAPPHRTAQLHHGLQICAASALAAASMCRSLFVAAFPLFAKRMYTVVGINWASNFLGMVAVLLTICLFSFIKYGISLSFPSCAPDAYG